jgi:signal transduction histidine kinase
LFTPEDRAAGVPEQEIKTADEKGRAEDERWHIRKDGSRFYASGVMMELKDGKGFVKIARDMTDKIATEKALRDREMLQKLVGAQEDERKRIARDLHDELGQQLTALRLQLESARKICEDEEVCSKIDEIQLLAKRIDNDVDFLAWELRPAVLDDLGLTVALDNYIKEWSRHSGVTAEFHGTGLKQARLLPEIETNFYRIAQEALNNTHKHAQASRANLLLEQHDGEVVMIIEDDGIGFEPENKENRNKGLGLIGMHERAALVGGILEIESAPGSGTTIFVRVPVSLTETKETETTQKH